MKRFAVPKMRRKKAVSVSRPKPSASNSHAPIQRNVFLVKGNKIVINGTTYKYFNGAWYSSIFGKPVFLSKEIWYSNVTNKYYTSSQQAKNDESTHLFNVQMQTFINNMNFLSSFQPQNQPMQQPMQQPLLSQPIIPQTSIFTPFKPPPLTMPVIKPFKSPQMPTFPKSTQSPMSISKPLPKVTKYPDPQKLVETAHLFFKYGSNVNIKKKTSNKTLLTWDDVYGLSGNKRAGGTTYGLSQINTKPFKFGTSGESGFPHPIVRNWISNLNTQSQNKNWNISFGTMKNTRGMMEKVGIKPHIATSRHMKSVHAEAQLFRELEMIYRKNKPQTSALTNLKMYTNLAHCAECWWAAHAYLRKRWGKNPSFILNTMKTGTENRLFKNWGEPWIGFFKELGLSQSPFRKPNGSLKNGLKVGVNSAQNLNYYQTAVRFK